MSNHEWPLLVAGIALALFFWGKWYLELLFVSRRGPADTIATVTPWMCGVLVFVGLRRWAAMDVRYDVFYLTLYTVWGAVWLGLSAFLFPILGLSVRDDVVERNNPAAAWLTAGALVGVAIAYIGANAGNGPGWQVVAFSAFLSIATLFATWAMMQLLTGAADAITIDRDETAGIRLGGAIVACGIILGRAVAGDWVSASATIRDFLHCAWPVLIFVVAEGVLGRAFRPSPRCPRPSKLRMGLLPGAVYVAASVAVVLWMGAP